jgi:hypothetical protein
MIPGHGDQLSQARVDALAVMMQGGCLAVQDLSALSDVASVCGEDALLAHAYPQHGDFASEVSDGFYADSGVQFWCAGSGTDDQLCGLKSDELLKSDLVIAVDYYRGAFEAKVLYEGLNSTIFLTRTKYTALT